MAAAIIDGKRVAAEVRERVAGTVKTLRRTYGMPPGLAVIRVGDDPASKVYVSAKRKAAASLGIHSEEHHLEAGIAPEALEALIDRLNRAPEVHGILLQLPLPGALDAERFLVQISPEKDVDGFHPVNLGRLVAGIPGFQPCTPAGILELIRRTGVEVAGKRAVVVGRSTIVGKPVALMLLAAHATVTVCHSRTPALAEVCREADILVVATGRAEMVRGGWIKPGAVVIDVGINRLPDGRLVGDVAFEEASAVAGHITPVPGGVGPMTVAMLMHNTVLACQRALQGAGVS